MAQVHIQRIPEEYQKNITARVIDYLDDSVRDSLTEAIWDDLVAISKNTGRPLYDKDRYFLDSLQEGELQLKLGSYKDFIASFNLLKVFEEAEESFPNTFSLIFNSIPMKVMGLQNLLVTKDGDIIIGQRSGKVQQAQGILCLPAGGFMPEFYAASDRSAPDPYLSSQKQIFSELGIKVDKKDLALTSIIRDTNYSSNISLIFESDLEFSRQEVQEAFRQHATDKWEHDYLNFIRAGTFSEVPDMAYFTSESKMVGTSEGAILDYGRRKSGEDWYEQAKQVLLDVGYEIID